MFIFFYLPDITFEYFFALALWIVFLVVLFLEKKHRFKFSKKELFLCFYPFVFFQDYYSTYSSVYRDFTSGRQAIFGLDGALGIFLTFFLHSIILFFLIGLVVFISSRRKIL